MKTRKAVASRFRVTATGQLKYNRPGKRHILTKKSGKKKRQLSRTKLVDAGQIKMYRRVLGIE
jgi:large subunit ribosomal protein L35